jgi:C-terminal processing protease CtpA/Prc
MKICGAVAMTFYLATSCLAATPDEVLAQQTALAQSLTEKHAYADAADLLEKLAADPSMTALPAWPDALYPLARAEAAAGHADKALAALRQAIDFDAAPGADTVADDTAFATLKNDARFQAQVARLVQPTALWHDNPAIATPFKPVLSDAEKAAGLSKIWSEAKFNFTFFGRVTDLDWDGAYVKFLPQALAAKTTEDYYRTLIRFAALLKDGHSRVIAPVELSDRLYALAPLMTAPVDGKVVVTEVSDPSLQAKGIGPGSELITVQGLPVQTYAAANVAPNVFGFTPQDREAWIYGYDLLRGPIDQPLALGFKRADGQTVTATVQRRKNPGMLGYFPIIGAPAEFKMLPGNVAYLHVRTMMTDDGAKLMRANAAAINAAKGLIIDVRHNGGGSSSNAFFMLQMMADKPFKAFRYTTRDYIAAERSWGRLPGWRRAPAIDMAPDPVTHISVPVTVLTDAVTYSSAEDFVVGFKTIGRGKTIGETTAGSTGNQIQFRLPGGGFGMICAKHDTFPDGRQHQGIGLVPDVTVKPTVADIRQGRDPVLEKAVALLTP